MTDYKVVLPIICSECNHITTFDVPHRTAKGATYDCTCGRLMLINDDLSTTDLHAKMAQDIYRECGFDVLAHGGKFQHVEL